MPKSIMRKPTDPLPPRRRRRKTVRFSPDVMIATLPTAAQIAAQQEDAQEEHLQMTLCWDECIRIIMRDMHLDSLDIGIDALTALSDALNDHAIDLLGNAAMLAVKHEPGKARVEITEADVHIAQATMVGIDGGSSNGDNEEEKTVQDEENGFEFVYMEDPARSGGQSDPSYEQMKK